MQRGRKPWRRRMLVGLGVLVGLLVGGVLLYSFGPWSRLSPVLAEGKTLSEWVLAAYRREPGAEAVINQLDPDWEAKHLLRFVERTATWTAGFYDVHGGQLPGKIRNQYVRLLRPTRYRNERRAVMWRLQRHVMRLPAGPVGELMWDSDQTVAYEAARLLGRMKEQGVEELERGLEEGSPFVQSMACHGIGIAGREAAVLAPALVEFLLARDTTRAAKSGALQALAKMGDAAYKGLAPHLEGDSAVEQAMVLEVFGAMTMPPLPAMPRIIRLAESDNQPVRCRAVALLGWSHPFGGEAETQVGLALEDEDPKVRTAGLAAVTVAGARAAALRERLEPLVNDPEASVRTNAVRALRSVGGG